MSTFLKSNVAIDPAAVVATYTAPMTNALIDLNFETNVYWRSGVIYESIAAMITAGFGDRTGGVQRITLPTLPAAFAIYAYGIAGTPATAYMVAMDDGSDGVIGDNQLAIAQGAVGDMSVLMVSNSVDQVSTNLQTAGIGGSGASIKVALRAKANDMSVSYNGAAVKTDASAALPLGMVNFVVGNRDDAVRPWSGTLKRLVLIGADLTNAELVTLAT